MQFPDSWFEDEVRDGFYVPALMKRAWASQMETLSEIAKVCEKYHIRWFAMWGTLLGAIRHKGYIPWDDDMDICMLRDDYIRFNIIAGKELPEGFWIAPNSAKAPGQRLHTTVWNSPGICLEKEHLNKYHGFPYVTGIDIYAIDYAAPDPEDEEFCKTLISLTFEAALSVDDAEQDPEETETKIAQIEEILNVQIDRHMPMREQLFTLVENLASMYTAEEANEVLYLPQWLCDRPYKWPLESFTNQIMLPFELMEVPAPSGYDAILRVIYGDYMTPSYAGSSHDYPYFGSQIEKLTENLTKIMGSDKTPFKYFFSMDDMKKTKNRDRKSAQKATEDFLLLAGKIHEEIFKAIEADSFEHAQKLLELCQNSAIRVGTLLEQVKGEGLTTVHTMEEYCELTYQIHEGLSHPLVSNASDVYRLLEELLIRIRDCVNQEIKNQKEVVFLPYKASLWKSLEPAWKQATADPDCNVHVIPIPYYYRNLDGSLKEMHYEGDQFPDYVPITDYNSYQLKIRQPDVIIIHNPYDEYNLTISVHPYFYSKELMQYTDMLIYTPYFTLDTIDPEDQKSIQNMEYYVTMPGIIHADKVLLHSEQMRQAYIDFLTKTAGADTRSIWEEKITVFSSLQDILSKVNHL